MAHFGFKMDFVGRNGSTNTSWAPTPEDTARLWRRASEIWENMAGQVLASFAVITGHLTYTVLSTLIYLVDYQCGLWICSLVLYTARILFLFCTVFAAYGLGAFHCDWVLQWWDKMRGQNRGRPRKSCCPKRKPPLVCRCAVGCCTCMPVCASWVCW